jgi:3-phosphoshikimate 1-carboxyvinyltransferase
MYDRPYLEISPITSASGTVRLPGSKSISNRALLLAALSPGRTTLRGLLDSDDTRVMIDALRILGCLIQCEDDKVEIQGINNLTSRQNPVEPFDLFLGNAGTAMRPLTATLALLGVHAKVHGVPRMHERPIKDLVDALVDVGCRIKYLGQEGYPPLLIEPRDVQQEATFKQRLKTPLHVRADVSSQFLSALLMALPLVARDDICIEVVGELISKPYIEITLKTLAQFGVHVLKNGFKRFVIPKSSSYSSPGQVFVEADASSASYFIALGALASAGPDVGGEENKIQSISSHSTEVKPALDSLVRIEGVGQDSIQGDIAFIHAAKTMGALVEPGPHWIHARRGAWPLRAIDLDCNAIPDAAMTLAVMALYADAPSTLRNIGSWRVKETDRIHAVATECRKLGAAVKTGADWIEVSPIPKGHWKGATIHTYDDHRMAMCFSLAALNPDRVPVVIEDPKCVGKTYPKYFQDFLGICHTPAEFIPVLCIDGPSASGKGTLATALAERLGYHYLDSGALYRVCAYAALQLGISLDIEHEERLADLARNLNIEFKGEQILLGGVDVSGAVRSEQGGINASKISLIPGVRYALVELQHSFRKLPGLVADGRDMGSVIFPNARLKVFLTASASERAKRRHKQLISKGFQAKIEDLLADLESRDLRDSTRSVAPLVPAKGACHLDNSTLSIEQSVAEVMRWWQEVSPSVQ